MADPTSGLLDTSVVIDLALLDPAMFPRVTAISTITTAELLSGIHSATSPAERALRIERLQAIEHAIAALPFDGACARAYGRIASAVLAQGRKLRGSRSLDLLIAATALAHDLPLYTRNASDFDGLEGLVRVIALP